VIIRGQSAAQKGAAAGESASVMRPPGGDNQPCPGSEHPLAQAAEAPAGFGCLSHGTTGDMHDLVGEAGDKQAHFIAGEGMRIHAVTRAA